MRLRIAFLISLGMVLLAFQWTAPLPEVPAPREDPNTIAIEWEINTQHKDSEEIPLKDLTKVLENFEIKPTDIGPDLTAILNLEPGDEILPDLGTSAVIEPEPDPTPPIYWVSEVMPEFPGGQDALRDYLKRNLRYPEAERGIGREGTVYLRFVVDEKGSVTQIEILRSPSVAFTKEALRVIEAMPRWTPGRQGGRNVKVYYRQDISFTLY